MHYRNSSGVLICVIMCIAVVAVMSSTPQLAASELNVNYLGSTLWGSINDVVVQGEYCYCANGYGLTILNTGDLTNTVAELDLIVGAEGALGIGVDLDNAYIACGDSGLQVIDISNPSSPSHVSSFATFGPARAVAIAGDLLIIAEADSGIQIVDISTPDSPASLSVHDTTYSYDVVQVSGQYAYVTSSSHNKVFVYDISAPGSPAIVGVYTSPELVQGIAVDGNTLYVSGAGTLSLVDVTDHANPTWVNDFYAPYTDGRDIAVIGNIAYLLFEYELITVDISTPLSLSQLDQCFLTNPSNALAAAGNYVFAGSSWGGLQAWDVTDPGNIVSAGEFRVDAKTYDVAMGDGYAFTANSLGGIQVIDISDPSAPTVVATMSDTVSAFGITLSDTLAFVATIDSTLRVVSIADPLHPSTLSELPLSTRATSFVVVDSLAYIGLGNNGMSIYSLADPAAPSFIGSYDSAAGYFGDIAVSGDYAYITGQSVGLIILNITDPSSPWLAGDYDTPGITRSLQIVGHTLYLADGTEGMKVLDIIDPVTPVLIGSYDTDGMIMKIQTVGSYAYLADWDGGLVILNIDDPSNPTLAGALDTYGYARNLAFESGLVLIADHLGLVVADVQAMPLSVDDDEAPSLLNGFALGQNYPNPFNPSTTIAYTVQLRSHVTIDVYNILGQIVQTLVDETKNAGSYLIDWDGLSDDGAEASSGIYLYRIRAGEFSTTKKMLLLR